MEAAKKIVNLLLETIKDDDGLRSRWEEIPYKRQEEKLYFLKEKVRAIIDLRVTE